MTTTPMTPEPVAIRRVVRELPDVFTMHLDIDIAGRRPNGFRFAPGQFNMLYVFGAGEVAISISGDPAEPAALVHTIRAVGAVTNVLCRLRRGDTLGVRGPFGRGWPVDEARGRDVLVIAGGLGLAPLRPAILHLLHRRDDYRRVSVLYGARTPDDLIFRKDLARWRGRLDLTTEVTVDRAPPGWWGHVGFAGALVSAARFDPANTVALMCGPEVMMRFTARELARAGIPAERTWLSMERNMKCALAQCGHCQLGPTFVCKDGPVFRLDEIGWLFYRREV
jgi:NAD(P)H-flavin reductase